MAGTKHILTAISSSRNVKRRSFRVRNQVGDNIVVTTHKTVLAAIQTYGLESSRIYNVDETSFCTRHRSTRVIAVKGYRNVWTQEVPPTLSLTIVACGNDAGEYITPTFVLIMTTANGFMTSSLFVRWLSGFSASTPWMSNNPCFCV